ncbi:MAG: cation transporter [Planctomycetota bacterium]|nr:cation transporter [Planctomycetota bacterium]
MKKSFKLEDLDCADCAAKIENALNRIDGVDAATVDIMTRKMTIEAADTRFDAVFGEVKKMIHKIDPDISVVA